MPILELHRGTLHVRAGTSILRLLLSLLILAAAIPVLLRSYSIFRADRIARFEHTLESYDRALAYDPANAKLWWNRGRLHHYSVGTIDIERAVRDYQTAVSLNPRLGQTWVDLADAFERTGRFREAESALEKALAVRTYSPLMRWQAGNFYLRRGNLPKMYECFKLASQYDVQKLGIAMELAWKSDEDHAGILAKLVPDDLQSNMRYLDFVISKKELDLAHPVWQRCLRNSIPLSYEFKPASAFNYIDSLLGTNQVAEALQVWDDALRKARTGLADNRLKPQGDGINLIWNGSFEEEILRGGFDWRYPDTPEMRFQVDIATRIDKLKSLRVTFGDVNISTGYLSQIIPVLNPGVYELDFYLQTEGLSTDQTPYISIVGFPDNTAVSARSGNFPATTSWSKYSIPFEVKENCKAVYVRLMRDRSSKFDNQIKGSLWLDGLAVRRQSVLNPSTAGGSRSIP
jgi:tetratricopeptide (TPR) repeat protein